MTTVTLACHAMATRFELVLHGNEPAALRAAGEEALAEIERLEARLSLFRTGSEIAHLNARAAREPVRVSPGLFALLQQAQRLSRETGGAFDITIAPLVRCWGFLGGPGRLPSAEELAAARTRVGMGLVELRPEDFTVRFARPGVMLDLGAIGKGYAVERAIALLREAGVTSALLHGGTSTIYALGHPPQADAWQVAVVNPEGAKGAEVRSPKSEVRSPESAQPAAGDAVLRISAFVPHCGRPSFGLRTSDFGLPPLSPDDPAPLAIVPLRDEALSVSAIWGRCFEAEGRTFGHVIDPRTGQPAVNALLAAVVLPSATETDALSTALLTLGPAGHAQIAGLRPGMHTLVALEAGGRLHVEARGIMVGGT